MSSEKVLESLGAITQKAKEEREQSSKMWRKGAFAWFQEQLSSNEFTLSQRLIEYAKKGMNYYHVSIREIPNKELLERGLNKNRHIRKLITKLNKKFPKLKFKRPYGCGMDDIEIQWK